MDLDMEDTMIVTFDFDNTLTCVAFDPEDGCFSKPATPNFVMLQCVSAHAMNGNEVHIVTSRSSARQNEVTDFLVEHNLQHLVSGVHFTEGQLKHDTLEVLGSRRHHDDDHEELKNLPAGCEALFVPNGWLDESGRPCNPDDPRFHFDNWVDDATG